MEKSDELLRDIARIEKDIEDLRDYRASLFVRNPSLTGWSRFVAGFQSRMAARQALRHLQYLRLEREIANHTYENLDKTRQRGPA